MYKGHIWKYDFENQFCKNEDVSILKYRKPVYRFCRFAMRGCDILMGIFRAPITLALFR